MPLSLGALRSCGFAHCARAESRIVLVTDSRIARIGCTARTLRPLASLLPALAGARLATNGYVHEPASPIGVQMAMTSHTLTLAFALCALGGCTVSSAPARPAPSRPARAPSETRIVRAGFDFLGERIVDGAVDHDVIHVGRRDGQFREIMLVVERAPVEIYDVVVTFGNGERFEPRTRLAYGPDTRSRTIDLPGGSRAIQRVDFRYGNVVAGARAKVELWGR
jgi:hypothetical protein